VIPYRARPGAGFVLLAVTVLGAAASFAWGAQTPRLERVWKMQIEMETGTGKALSRSELAMFQDVLVQYPSFAGALLDAGDTGIISAHEGDRVDTGYAYIVRKSSAEPLTIVITPSATAKVPVQVRVRGSFAEGRGEATLAEPFTWRVPDRGPFPQLLEVRFPKDGPGKRQRTPMLVRMTRQ
jgi:hypothetical protein